MTQKLRFTKSKFHFDDLTSGQICFGLFAIFSLLLILRNTSIAIEYMNRGLLLCAKTVIPSLFPFMVLSELIVSGGIGRTLLKRISKPFCKLFRISADGCCAVLLGMLCGFPIGARCATIAYTSGRITREEAERILCFSNNPSSAFLISAVGGSLWGNQKFGVALYVSVLSASILTGILMGMTAKKPLPETEQTQPTVPVLSSPTLFCNAVKSALMSMLLVCAYVVFFSALVGTFNFMPGMQKLPAFVQSFLFCLFELSSGMSQAASLASPFPAALLCAFAAGWSGLSVHCQILSVCDQKGLSLRPYAFAKLFQAILTPLLLSLILFFFPDLLIPAIGA